MSSNQQDRFPNTNLKAIPEPEQKSKSKLEESDFLESSGSQRAEKTPI